MRKVYLVTGGFVMTVMLLDSTVVNNQYNQCFNSSHVNASCRWLSDDAFRSRQFAERILDHGVSVPNDRI